MSEALQQPEVVDDEAQRRYRETMARMLMGGSGQRSSPAVASTGDASWMNGLASTLGGATNGYRMAQAQQNARGAQFSSMKAFDGLFGGMGAGMKGPVA